VIGEIGPDGTGPWRRKVDPELQALVERVGDEPAGRQRAVRVLVRFRGDPERLREGGFELGTVAGDVAVAVIPLGRIADAASRPEVLFVELGRALGPGDQSR
jgi:hypothetical protein